MDETFLDLCFHALDTILALKPCVETKIIMDQLNLKMFPHGRILYLVLHRPL